MDKTEKTKGRITKIRSSIAMFKAELAKKIALLGRKIESRITEEPDKVLHLEQSFVWITNVDIKKNGQFLNVVL